MRTKETSTPGTFEVADGCQLRVEHRAGVVFGWLVWRVRQNLVPLSAWCEALVQCVRENGGVGCASLTHAGTKGDEAFRPNAEISRTGLQCGISLREGTLERSRIRTVGGPERTSRPIEELSPLTHGASHDAKTI
jgi:hypothetical protein